ncbi:hypothetical protein [Mycolicibacterium rutilum]|uniref:hypothetical protein n=1 Tax=Mycolicibacterium rutilum TaxID=370526 RepID=UPI001F344C49|nr:hypothetical protein [Mycolicibacterium rutilum]
MTAAVTISVTSGDGGGDDPVPPQETYGLASADDTGPVNIITEDPTCAAWTPINDNLAAVIKRGWNKRDPNVSEADWTAELRSQYEEVGEALTRAADQTVRLAEQTPHRAMRELFEQFIAYGRAFTDTIPRYTKDDNHLALAAITTANVIVYVCSAIHYGSAASRAPLVDPLSASPEPAVLRDPNDARRMLETDDPTCPEWDRILHRFDDDTRAWQGIDPNLPAAQWNSEQRAVIDGVIPLMKEFADEFERLGMQTSNPVLRDFAMFAAQYRRAHAEALPTYTPADNYLDLTAWRTTSVIYEACKAAGV